MKRTYTLPLNEQLRTALNAARDRHECKTFTAVVLDSLTDAGIIHETQYPRRYSKPRKAADRLDVTLSLSSEIWDALRAEAKRQYDFSGNFVSMSTIIRTALARHLRLWPEGGI